MDLRLAEYLTAFELQERWRAAARLRVRPPFYDRDAAAATIGLGHVLVRAGTRLERLADHCLPDDAPLGTNPDPCHGCANWGDHGMEDRRRSARLAPSW